MSYTTVKAVWPGEKSGELETLRNSHGSAPVVWRSMVEKYIGKSSMPYIMEIEKLWPKWKDLSIPEHQRAVLMMTFDRAYIAKENYQRAASDIKKFLEDFPVGDGLANHWPRIAEIFESNPQSPAIGFWQTSVSEDLFCGEWDEEDEEYGDPDWDDFYEIYSELDALPKVGGTMNPMQSPNAGVGGELHGNREESLAKCTRCRNIHAETDRTESRKDKHGFRHSECPRCGWRTFTILKE